MSFGPSADFSSSVGRLLRACLGTYIAAIFIGRCKLVHSEANRILVYLQGGLDQLTKEIKGKGN